MQMPSRYYVQLLGGLFVGGHTSSPVDFHGTRKSSHSAWTDIGWLCQFLDGTYLSAGSDSIENNLIIYIFDGFQEISVKVGQGICDPEHLLGEFYLDVSIVQFYFCNVTGY